MTRTGSAPQKKKKEQVGEGDEALETSVTGSGQPHDALVYVCILMTRKVDDNNATVALCWPVDDLSEAVWASLPLSKKTQQLAGSVGDDWTRS